MNQNIEFSNAGALALGTVWWLYRSQQGLLSRKGGAAQGYQLQACDD